MNSIIEQVLNINPTQSALHSMLRLAWQSMTIGQRLRYLKQPDVNELLAQAGASFTTDDLVDQIRSAVSELEAEIESHDYQIMQGENGFFWETMAEASEDFADREDAVFAAHSHLVNNAR